MYELLNRVAKTRMTLLDQYEPFRYRFRIYARPKSGRPHDDVIKWKHFPCNWPFVRGFHRSPVNSQHKGQWRGALVFSLICVWINDWVNNREASDLRRYRAHYDVIVKQQAGLSATVMMTIKSSILFQNGPTGSGEISQHLVVSSLVALVCNPFLNI